ncbi:hypothetical protein [Flammeovirga sp. SubArs3]|uniref:hypothetical protein n=1 Tax=Flammeovirga sp. SubArs3 TaxID=2995316 RepID=UPI00248CF1F2|nr:hypothetical protein [Flammeovirga sp. SubArs3]
MNKIIFLIVGLCLSYGVKAHNPLSAKFYLEKQDSQGLLSIYLSQDGVDAALLKAYGEKEFENYTVGQYKSLIVRYIKEKFKLNINGKEIILLDGGIKLGKHQTDLKFITTEVPSKIHTLKVQIEAFSENEDHQSLFVYKIGESNGKAILSNRNDFTDHFTKTVETSGMPQSVAITIGAVLILLFILFTERRRLI